MMMAFTQTDGSDLKDRTNDYRSSHFQTISVINKIACALQSKGIRQNMGIGTIGNLKTSAPL